MKCRDDFLVKEGTNLRVVKQQGSNVTSGRGDSQLSLNAGTAAAKGNSSPERRQLREQRVSRVCLLVEDWLAAGRLDRKLAGVEAGIAGGKKSHRGYAFEVNKLRKRGKILA